MTTAIVLISGVLIGIVLSFSDTNTTKRRAYEAGRADALKVVKELLLTEYEKVEGINNVDMDRVRGY